MKQACWHSRHSRGSPKLARGQTLDAKLNRTLNFAESRACQIMLTEPHRGSDRPCHVIFYYNHSWIATFLGYHNIGGCTCSHDCVSQHVSYFPRPPSVQCCVPNKHGTLSAWAAVGIRTAEPPRHHAEEILRSRTRDRATLHLQHCLDGVAGEVVKHILSFLEGLHRNCQQFLYSRTQRIQKKTWGANQKRYPTRSYLHHRKMVQNLLSAVVTQVLSWCGNIDMVFSKPEDQ